MENLMQNIDENKREEIEEQLNLKLSGNEMDEGPCIPVIHEFIESELARLESKEFIADYSSEHDTAELDKLIWDVLHKIRRSNFANSPLI